MSELKKYQHLERLGTTEVDGINVGECYIFPKLDGTNGSIWYENGEIYCGSRNRVLTEDADNAGFCKYVKDNEDLYKKFFLENPSCTLYGEWLVPHTLKTYRKDAWRKFYIFDVYEYGLPLHYEVYKNMLEDFDLEYLAPLKKCISVSEDSIRKLVDQNTYLIEDGKGVGEGIVVKNYSFRNKFGRVTWAKTVTNSFREDHVKSMGVNTLEGSPTEELIVDKYVTKHLVDKVKSKIEVEYDGWSSKFIPRLLSTVYYDLINEEMWEIIKTFKEPKIDFKFLSRLTTAKIKQLLPEVF